MKRTRNYKIIAAGLACVFALSFSMPAGALAYRSDSGGGDTQEFSIGKFALGTAIGMASSFAGSALSSGSGLGSLVGNTSSFSMGSAFTSWGTGYASSLGTGQLQRAMYAMGNYYGWSGQSKMLAGTMASSIGSGLISSAGSGSLTGLGSGVAEGLVKGGILMLGSNTKGEYDPWVGFAAGLAGDVAGGAVTGGSITGNLLQSIPSNLISVAQSSATEGKDMMDRYIINQAFTGAHAAAGGLAHDFTSKKLGLKTGFGYSGGVKEYGTGNKSSSGTGSGVSGGIGGGYAGDSNATADLSGSTLPLDSNLGTMTTAFPDTVDYPVGYDPVMGYQPDTTAYSVPSAPTLVDSSVNSVTPITLVSAESTPYNLTLASTPSSVQLPSLTDAEWNNFVNTPTTGDVSQDIALSYAPTYLQELYQTSQVTTTPAVTPEFTLTGPIQSGLTSEDIAALPKIAEQSTLVSPLTSVDLEGLGPAIEETAELKVAESPTHLIRPLADATIKPEPRMPTTEELLPNLDSLPKTESMFQPVAPLNIPEIAVTEAPLVTMEDLEYVPPEAPIPGGVFDPNRNTLVVPEGEIFVKVGDVTFVPGSMESTEPLRLPDGTPSQHIKGIELNRQTQLEQDYKNGVITEDQRNRMKNEGIVYYSPQLVQKIDQTCETLSAQLGTPVQVIVTGGYDNPEYRQYKLQRGIGDAAIDSTHSITAKLEDGTEVPLVSGLDVRFVTVNPDGSNSPVDLNTAYAALNTVGGNKVGVGIYKDGHFHVEESLDSAAGGSLPARWQSGVDIIPRDQINNPHSYATPISEVAAYAIDEGTDFTKKLETGSGSWRALMKSAADVANTYFGIGPGIKSFGDFQIRSENAREYMLDTNRESLGGYTDEEINSLDYQRKLLEDPTTARQIFQWLVVRNAQDLNGILSGAGYSNAAVNNDQVMTSAYAINYGSAAKNASIIQYGVIKAARSEGLIPSGQNIASTDTENIFTAFAENHNTSVDDGYVAGRSRAALSSDGTFTVRLGDTGQLINISNPGKETLISSLGSKLGVSTDELPEYVYITGSGYNGEKVKLMYNPDSDQFDYYRRDTVAFLKSPTGRAVIESVGGIQNIIPTSVEVLQNKEVLGPYVRGANVSQHIILDQVNAELRGNSVVSSVPLDSGAALNIPTNVYQPLTGANTVTGFTSPKMTFTTPSAQVQSTVPDVKTLKERNTVTAETIGK